MSTRGRKMFSSTVGRPNFKRTYSTTSKTANSGKHQYGDDWPEQSKLCKQRDNYRCKAHKIGLPACTNRFPPPLTNLLHAHHIVPWIKCKTNKLSNLITLCITCHERHHHKKIGCIEISRKQIEFSKKLR